MSARPKAMNTAYRPLRLLPCAFNAGSHGSEQVGSSLYFTAYESSTASIVEVDTPGFVAFECLPGSQPGAASSNLAGPASNSSLFLALFDKKRLISAWIFGVSKRPRFELVDDRMMISSD